MTNDLIATDHPLSPSQQQVLSALLDSILPASDDGHMPSTRELDFIGYLNEKERGFISDLVEVVGHFDDTFVGSSLSERYRVVDAFSKAQPQLFDPLLTHIYACCYQQERVLEGMGMAAGPPFPRGNAIEMGDLSLLDRVMQKSRSYRR